MSILFRVRPLKRMKKPVASAESEATLPSSPPRPKRRRLTSKEVQTSLAAVADAPSPVRAAVVPVQPAKLPRIRANQAASAAAISPMQLRRRNAAAPSQKMGRK